MRWKVIRFLRGARRQPRKDLPAALNPRDKQFDLRERSSPGLVLGRVVFWVTLTIVVLPFVADVANGMLTAHDGCRVIAVIDGSNVKLHCPNTGFVDGRIIGHESPEVFSPHCVSEFSKGVAAMFHLRWQLWMGSHITARPSGRELNGRTLTFLAVDSVGVARPMVEIGLAHWYDGGARGSWCK